MGPPEVPSQVVSPQLVQRSVSCRSRPLLCSLPGVLAQVEQMVLISAQKVRRPLGSRGQLLSTLGGGEKKAPVRDLTCAVSAQIVSRWGQKIREDRAWEE